MPIRTLTLIFAVLLVACGGSSEPASEAAPGDPPVTASGTTPPEVPAQSTQSPKPLGGDPCDLLTRDDIATALGADVALVSDGGPGPFTPKNAKDCVWDVDHSGIEDTVTLWMRFRNEKTAPDAWSKAIQSYLDNGETIGSKTLTHEPSELGGVSGALSEIYGSKYVKARIFSWHADEEVLYRLTVSRSLDTAESLPDPPVEAFESLVAAVLQ